jgi:Ras-related protein Rab-4B
LVGNKVDLERERMVSYKEADQFAHDNGMTFVETSAVTGDGVEQTFMKCASSILTKVELGQISPETMSGIQYGTKTFHTMQTIDPVMSGSGRRSCCFK